ncbi:MAG: nuclear transport factor 2 family protein [Candidatus Acidiferrum sp.]
MTTTTENNVISAEGYYQALQQRDFAEAARHLNPDVKFVGPLSDLAGKEAVLKAAKQFLTLLKGLTMHTTFGSKVRYSAVQISSSFKLRWNRSM